MLDLTQFEFWRVFCLARLSYVRLFCFDLMHPEGQSKIGGPQLVQVQVGHPQAEVPDLKEFLFWADLELVSLLFQHRLANGQFYTMSSDMFEDAGSRWHTTPP